MTTKQRSRGHKRRKRPWSVIMIALLLLLEGALLTLLTVWRMVLLEASIPTDVTDAIEVVLTQLLLPVGLGIAAVFAITSAYAVLRGLRPGWTGAMLVQSLVFILAFVMYFSFESWYVFIMIAYGIALVVYLNTFDVREFFRPFRRTESEA